MIATTVSLRCRCGGLGGEAHDVSRRTVHRMVCYCDDCQAFARFLGRDDILDAHGGTDVAHMAPAQVRITAGTDQLRCLRLSEKGGLRWYAGCCHTPVANLAPHPQVPFASLIGDFMVEAQDGRSREEVLGPPRGRVMARFAHGEPPSDAHPAMPKMLLARILASLARARLAGKHRPSPFFDATTGKPVVEPYVLSREERTRVTPAAT